ncbi:MAG: phage tail protein [Clostridia bacterium]|nr:phage tail protein [Clostridia bacterium]
MSQTKNKIKYNLKNVHVAKLTKSEMGEYSYGTPKSLQGAVSLSLDAEGEANPFYADGVVFFRSVTNNGYSGDLEIALIPDWFREEILGEIRDANGVLIETANNVSPVYFAMLFEFDGDQHAIRHVLYNCTVSTRPTLESSTKEDSIEPGTETLSISADPREDGLVKAKTGDDTDASTYQNWYGSVYIPVTDGSGSEEEPAG